MFLSNVLLETKLYLSHIRLFDGYEIQITPDEKPFAYTGEKVITLYGDEISRVDPMKEIRQYFSSFKLCVSYKTTSTPTDRQYGNLYTSYYNSLSTISTLLLSILDSNNTLLSSIVTSINNTVNRLEREFSGPTVEEQQLLNSLGNIGAIGPLIGLGYTAQPIPRYDDFFTSYNTKREVIPSAGDNRLVPYGYSMIVSIKGPFLILPKVC